LPSTRDTLRTTIQNPAYALHIFNKRHKGTIKNVFKKTQNELLGILLHINISTRNFTDPKAIYP
jgi:hypothetical protein